MKRDFTLDELAGAIRRGWGAEVASVAPLNGRSHSLNFRVEAEGRDGAAPIVFVAKCIPSAKVGAFVRLLAHTASVRSPNASTRLFGGSTLDFGKWKVIALKWVEGRVRHADGLSPDEISALVAGHAGFIAGLSDDGHILPIRDAAPIKAALLEEMRRAGAKGIVRELRLIDDASLSLAPGSVRIIHGDMHHENFRFADGGGCEFLDLEEFRFGTPAEDFVRYVVCSEERRRWHDFARRGRLLAAFAGIVRRSPYTRREWLFAVNGCLLRKLAKKLRGGKAPSLFTRLNLASRFGFYREMREIVCAAKPSERTRPPTVVKVFGGTVRRFMGAETFDWSGGVRFTCDPACDDFDWLCVYDEISHRLPGVAHGALRVPCPVERSILATQEPVSVKSYNAAYTAQFGRLLTNRPQEAEAHPGYAKGEGYLVWYTGRSFAEERARAIPEKTKLVSAVCSSKRMRHTRHADRFRLLETLKREIPGLDWFGKGVRPVEAKFEALDDYKYHVAVENHVAPGHWTEKLADAIVCGCLPFYAGDPEVGKVLPPECFIPIPMDDPARAAAIIREAMANGEWDKRRGAIEEARRILFERCNLFAQLAALVVGRVALNAPNGGLRASRPTDAPTPQYRTIYTRRRMRSVDPSAAFADLESHARRLMGPLR